MANPKSKSKPPYWIWIGAALALALAGSGALLMRNAPRLISAAIHQELAALGFKTVRFELENEGWGRSRLTHLEIGDPVTLRLPEVSIGYSLASLLTGRLDDVRFKELELGGHLGPDGLSLGAVDSVLGRTSEPPEPGTSPAAHRDSTAPEIPVERIEIEDARLRIDTEDGALQGELWASLDDSRQLAFRFQSTALDGAEKLIGYTLAPFSVDGEATLDAQHRSLQLQPLELHLGTPQDPSATVTVHVPAVEMHQEGGLGADVRIHAKGGSMALGRPGIDLEGVEFDLDWDPSSGLPRGRVEVSKIQLSGREPWLAPLTLRSELAPGENSLTADIDLTGPSRRFILRVQATQDFAAAAGNARIRLAPLAFGGPDADLSRLLPGLKRVGIEAWGELTLRGTAGWTRKKAGFAVALGLQNVSAAMGSTQISCLNGVIELQGLPLETAGTQEISMAQMDIGLRLRDGRIRFRLQPTGELIIERGEWNVAGGTVLTAGQYDAGQQSQEFLLAVDRVQFAELIELLPMEGLTGSGVLSGRLPVLLADDRVEIRGGILASEGGGWLRYRPEGGSQRLADYGVPELMDLEAVLANFRFTIIELQIDGDTRGQLDVRVRLEGANPDHLDGHPYVLNLNIQGPLIDLYSGGVAGYKIPSSIETAHEKAFDKDENPSESERANPCPGSIEPESSAEDPPEPSR
ncbi:MAG: YdbH domain-containing protein [Myxococcota bacterium]|nr:YdbH domain-containing protein [Myxococcota bacterium]